MCSSSLRPMRAVHLQKLRRITSSEEDGALRFGTTPRLYGKRTSTAWPPPTSTRTQHLRETGVSRRRGRTVILRRDSTTTVRRPFRSEIGTAAGSSNCYPRLILPVSPPEAKTGLWYGQPLLYRQQQLCFPTRRGRSSVKMVLDRATNNALRPRGLRNVPTRTINGVRP